MEKRERENLLAELSNLFTEIFDEPIEFVDVTDEAAGEDYSNCEDCDHYEECFGDECDCCDCGECAPVGISPVKVIFNNPATIIYWSDNTRTVVKCQSGDKFDAEKGLAMAVLKKLAGNDGSYNNFLNHWLKNAIVERV